MELTSQPLPTAALQMAEPASSYVSFTRRHCPKCLYAIRTEETIPSNYEQAGDGHVGRVLGMSRDVVLVKHSFQ